MQTLRFDERGLVPCIVQDHQTREVLMLGWADAEALEQTRTTGLVTFFSRSRARLWTKGETSGNHLHLESMRVDCDGDAVLIEATPAGPTCHTGENSCFHEVLA
jgi:phosphoribosyl-ATP pyrophosphohydrolase/phosphoribosyl-AMP cyclohydrolase